MGKSQVKVAIMTGSGAGIEKEIARTYASVGAKVVIADFNEEALNSTVDEFKEAGLTGGRFGLAYTTAKHTVVGMTKTLLLITAAKYSL